MSRLACSAVYDSLPMDRACADQNHRRKLATNLRRQAAAPGVRCEWTARCVSSAPRLGIIRDENWEHLVQSQLSIRFMSRKLIPVGNGTHRKRRSLERSVNPK